MFYFYEKPKKEYFDYLHKYFDNLNNINNNKTFWKTAKPFLPNKKVSKEKITVVENNEIHFER